MSLSPYKQLELEWKRLHAFRGALSMLRWDSAVMMPRGSAEIRGEQLAALETEYHALLTTPKVTRLLDRAQAGVQTLDDWQIANLREMRRQRDHAIATPAALIARLAKATSRAESKWLEARESRQFEIFAPHLDEVLQLVRDKALLLGQALHLSPYDALVDEFSPGVTSLDIEAMFKALSRRLPSLIRESIAAQETRPPLALAGKFPAPRQRALAIEMMTAFGFPFDRGRLDESPHPFTEGVSGDIRVTTRFDPAEPFRGLLGALHETGHAMYSVGLPPQWRDQPVGADRGMGVEESQALLFEMVIGRSRAFARYLEPLLKQHFGVTGPEWGAENIYAHLTRVRRSLIRVDADELTYPLHVMHRYDLEKKLLTGELAVKHLPEAWNAGMEARFGLRAAHDGEGCLQDIHWAMGSFGYFPSYALGSALAAQLFEALRTDLPHVDTLVERGDFQPVVGWLREHVHRFGCRYSAQELLQQSTEKPLGAQALLRYLESKYMSVDDEANSAAA